MLACDPDGDAARGELEQFDVAYTAMLDHLDTMWNGSAEGQWPTFGDAVGAMVELRVLSCFTIMRRRVPAELVADLASIYPGEFEHLARYTDLDRPVFDGPRFRNTAA